MAGRRGVSQAAEVFGGSGQEQRTNAALAIGFIWRLLSGFGGFDALFGLGSS